MAEVDVGRALAWRDLMVSDYSDAGQGRWLSGKRIGVPLGVLRDTVQPFPTFSEVYVAALKALHDQIASKPQPAGR